MSTIVPASALAAAVPLCQPCVLDAGLCVGCAEHDRSILPQLKQAHWQRDAHSGREDELPTATVVDTWPTPEEKKALRKAARNLARAYHRLRVGIAGGFTQSRQRKTA